MRLRPRTAAKIAAAPMVLVLTSCGGSGGTTVDVVTIGAPSAPFDMTTRISPPAQLIRGATAEGLVSLDEQGRIVPAIADRWIITDDGSSYIFRLRDGVWGDGSRITAESVRPALRQAIASLRDKSLALDFAGIEDIRVMAHRVIELRLAGPQPDLLLLLAQPELGLLHRARGTGPMSLTRNGNIATLTPIAPEKRGLPAVDGWADSVRTLRLTALPPQQAIEAFNLGNATVMLGGTLANFPLVDSAGLSRGTVQLDPVAGLFGLAIVNDDGFLALPLNREALALAIDRNRLIADLGVGGWTPSTRIVTPGVPGDDGTITERWSDLSLDARRALAAARILRWRAGKPGPVQLRIAMPSGPGADRIFASLADDFSRIGLVAVRAGENAPADLRLADTVARYLRASWYLNQLSCAAQRGICDAKADQLAAQAITAPDAARRAALLTQAEAELTSANVFIPFGPPIRWSLVRGDTTGFATNSSGYHPLLPLALRTK